MKLMKYSILIILTLAIIYCVGQDKSAIQTSFDIRIINPPTTVVINGQLNLVYELHISNLSSGPLLIEGIEILNLENSVSVLVFNEDQIRKRLYMPGVKSQTATIDSGGIGVFYIEAVIENLKLPTELFHRVTFQKPGQSNEQLVIDKVANTLVSQHAPLVLGPPVSGGAWAAVYEPSWERGHRRVIYAVAGQARIPGRFAIDFIKLDNDGRTGMGDKNMINNWYGYGEDVLAVANGIILTTRDDFPESSTLSDHPTYAPIQATGNYISMEIGKNQFVFYEHLKPGSIRVKPGQSVKKGDVIARLGFTGQTTGPHLHLHVADRDSPLGSEGIPFVFENFTLLGHYPDFNDFEKVKWQALDPGADSSIKNECPGPNTVISFK
jgi:murein DD-endopeptidase